MVLITRICFVTSVTAHVWRLAEVTGLCHWGEMENFTGFHPFCAAALLCAGFTFLERHCWSMWCFLIFFSVIMRSDCARKCWGIFRSCYDTGIKGVFRCHRGIVVIIPSLPRFLKLPQITHLQQVLAILHMWSCPGVLVCTAEVHSSHEGEPLRTAATGVRALMITLPHPHPPFHPS